MARTKNNDKYTYKVTWSEEDGEYVGLCAEFPGLSWLDETQEAAINGIKKVVRGVIEDMKRSGEQIPEPFATLHFSGKFMVRIPQEEHRRLAMEAAEAGVSINRLASAKLGR